MAAKSLSRVGNPGVRSEGRCGQRGHRVGKCDHSRAGCPSTAPGACSRPGDLARLRSSCAKILSKSCPRHWNRTILQAALVTPGTPDCKLRRQHPAPRTVDGFIRPWRPRLHPGPSGPALSLLLSNGLSVVFCPDGCLFSAFRLSVFLFPVVCFPFSGYSPMGWLGWAGLGW